MRAIFNFAKYEYRGNENEIIYKDNPVKILSHLRLIVGTYTIKRLLNHKTKRDDVTAGYTVLTPEELRKPAQAIEDEILIQAGLKQQKVGVTEQINNLLAGLSEVEKHKVLLQISDH